VTGRASLFTLDNLLAKNRNIRVRPEPKWRIGQYWGWLSVVFTPTTGNKSFFRK